MGVIEDYKDVPLLPEVFEAPSGQEKPLKVVKRKKYLADPDVVKALKKSLDTCTDRAWTCGVVILYDYDTREVYTQPVFERDIDMFNCIELMKLRYMSVSEEGEEDDED